MLDLSYTVGGHQDAVGETARAADLGLDGIESYGWETEDLDDLAAAADENGVEIVSVLGIDSASVIDDASPAIADPDSFETVVADLEDSIDVAARVGADNVVCTVGQNQDDVDDHAQHTAIVRAMRAVAPTAEDAGVTIVLEPLNRRVSHPGYYLESSYEAYEIVDAVDSPNVRVLFDIYHQQVSEGNIIRNLRNNVEYIGLFHVADAPGRHEPGTGELNYANILAAIDDLEYDGYVSFEFAPEGDPDEALRSSVELARDAAED